MWRRCPLQGLRRHMEEHLSAVRTLCGFADDRIADVNQLHDRFEERIEDLHASHRWAALRMPAA